MGEAKIAVYNQMGILMGYYFYGIIRPTVHYYSSVIAANRAARRAQQLQPTLKFKIQLLEEQPTRRDPPRLTRIKKGTK